MMGQKEEKTIQITRSMELLLWLIVIFIIVSFTTVIRAGKSHSDNDYSIFLNDVDGLIVGSPVRMMGIEVGHITKIKPTNEEVYLKFIITDETITIPQGTSATVEFNGMAGSKSLELYLPDKNTYVDKSTPIITVNPPKRLHDAAGLLNEMFDKISSIMNITSSFGEKVQNIEIPQGSEFNINKFLQYADNMVEDSNKKADNLNTKLIDYQRGKGIK